MKTTITKISLLTFILFLSTSCSTHTSINSRGVDGPAVMIDDGTLESNIKISGKIEGTGSTKYLFGFIPLGSTHKVEGVWGDGVGASIMSSLNKDHAKMEATYNALVSSGADIIIEPRYEITTRRNFFMTTVDARVHGFKGVVESYSQYKQDKPSYLEENYGYPPEHVVE